MTNRISEIAGTLRQIGEIQVTDWDFMALMQKDIGGPDVTRSLRRLANLQVMDWDFRTVLPAVTKLAQTEVDLGALFRRSASDPSLEWDFQSLVEQAATPASGGPTHEEMVALTGRLKNFLEYVVVNLIAEPNHCRIQVEEIESEVLRFRLVMVKRDVALLIGMEGRTAGAIRGLLKAAAGARGVHALLEILSHEEHAQAG